MPETLTETFARFAEDAEFRRWNEGRKPESRFVYVFQDASVWKFTLEGWWRFVTRTIRNSGAYNLPSANQLQGHRKKVADVADYNNATRSVKPVRWSVDDWKNELAAI